MQSFHPSHWEAVKQSEDENVDPFSLVQHCVNMHDSPQADYEIVRTFFENFVGNFLCCGSNDGLDQSYHLLDKGWKGVYVEPDPYACGALLKATEKYKDQVTIINSAIFPDTGIKCFNIATSKSYISSGLADWPEKHGAHAMDVRQIFVNAITLTDIMSWLDYNVDYIQTDIEGLDIDVISSFDWSLAKSCKMICTEAGPAVLKQLCQQGDFMITDITTTNSFYKRKEYV